MYVIILGLASSITLNKKCEIGLTLLIEIRRQLAILPQNATHPQKQFITSLIVIKMRNTYLSNYKTTTILEVR